MNKSRKIVKHTILMLIVIIFAGSLTVHAIPFNQVHEANIVNSESAFVSKDEFLKLLDTNSQISSYSRFVDLKNSVLDVIELTPEDMWIICSASYTSNDYGTMPISISYAGDGIFVITQEDMTVTARGASGERTESQIIDYIDSFKEVSLRATAYCTVFEEWVYGSTVYFTYRGGYVTTEKNPNSVFPKCTVNGSRWTASKTERTEHLVVTCVLSSHFNSYFDTPPFRFEYGA